MIEREYKMLNGETIDLKKIISIGSAPLNVRSICDGIEVNILDKPESIRIKNLIWKTLSDEDRKNIDKFCLDQATALHSDLLKNWKEYNGQENNFDIEFYNR